MEEPDRPTPGERGGWYARHYYGPVGPETLKVTGECEFPTPSYPSSAATQSTTSNSLPIHRNHYDVHKNKSHRRASAADRRFTESARRMQDRRCEALR
jgi:hypothetical protein